MMIRELWQIRFPPGTPEEQVQAAHAAADPDVPKMVRRSTIIKYLIARAMHPVIHFYVQYRTFDFTLKRVIHYPDHWVCALCHRGMIRQ